MSTSDQILSSEMFLTMNAEETVDMLCDLVAVLFGPLERPGHAASAILSLLDLFELTDQQRDQLAEYLRNGEIT